MCDLLTSKVTGERLATSIGVSRHAMRVALFKSHDLDDLLTFPDLYMTFLRPLSDPYVTSLALLLLAARLCHNSDIRLDFCDFCDIFGPFL